MKYCQKRVIDVSEKKRNEIADATALRYFNHTHPDAVLDVSDDTKLLPFVANQLGHYSLSHTDVFSTNLAKSWIREE